MLAPKPVNSLAGRITMSDGHSIPQFGLGVYEMTDSETYASVKAALEAGYRHIDSAEWYDNEEPAGKAIADFIRESGTPREEIFFTTKLKHNRGYDETLRDLRTSLKKGGVGYYDLYLVHSALGGSQARLGVWKALVDAQKEGLVKSIGVSNWSVRHFEELKEHNLPTPVLNQIDVHPFRRHEELVKYCLDHNILIEAWGPLARAMRFDYPVLKRIAEEKKRDQGQIMLRWGLQHGNIIIPKSVSPKRIVSNAQIFDFELSDEEMAELDKLDENLITDWDWVDHD